MRIHMLTALCISAATFTISMPVGAEEKVGFTEYCTGMMFRETAYTDMRCARKISYQSAEGIRHFELDYDLEGRLIELRYMLNGNLRGYSDRFVRAPRITISYEGNKETRRFYNEWGHRMLASGDLYEAQYLLDENGRRTQVTFKGLDGTLVDNDFGIAKYEWQTENNGEVLEHRYNVAGDIVRNRPGFGYFITRFAYDSRGFLTRMYNLGTDGKKLTGDDAGIAMTQISYDNHGQFIQWLNLDLNGKAKRGMSAIAAINYIPSKFDKELEATFNDTDGSPQTTRWGAHKVIYEYDEFGNPTLESYFDIEGNATNTQSGISQIRSKYSKDGAHRLEEGFYNNKGKPIAVGSANRHATVTELDAKGRPQTTSFRDLSNNPLFHKGAGYAYETIIYSPEGHLIERNFTNLKGGLSNHSTWGVAKFKYEYKSNGELVSVRSYTADGIEKPASWNPAH